MANNRVNGVCQRPGSKRFFLAVADYFICYSVAAGRNMLRNILVMFFFIFGSQCLCQGEKLRAFSDCCLDVFYGGFIFFQNLDCQPAGWNFQGTAFFFKPCLELKEFVFERTVINFCLCTAMSVS